MGELRKVEPITKEYIGICKTHGKYTSIKTKSTISNDWLGGRCPTCSELENSKSDSNKKKRLISPLPKRFQNCTFENYKISSIDKQRDAYNFARNYAHKFSGLLKTGGSMIFNGSCGTGKTHLACSIANFIVEHNLGDCLYTKVYDLTNDVKSSWSDINLNEKEIIKYYCSPDLLIIDEVGVQYGSESEQLILFRILNSRYEDLKPTMIISNLNESGLTKFLSEPIVDRMYEGGGGMVAFDWDSHRK